MPCPEGTAFKHYWGAVVCFKILSSLKWNRYPLRGKRKHRIIVRLWQEKGVFGPLALILTLTSRDPSEQCVRTAETTTISTNCTLPCFIARVSTTYAVRSRCSASLRLCCCVALMHRLSSPLLTSYLKPMTGFHWPASPCRLPSPSKLSSFLLFLSSGPAHWAFPTCTGGLPSHHVLQN